MAPFRNSSLRIGVRQKCDYANSVRLTWQVRNRDPRNDSAQQRIWQNQIFVFRRDDIPNKTKPAPEGAG
jgi:hypothetical protein